MGVKLINYKLFTGIYIEYESKEKGKEYFGYDGKLRFKGKYLNGKRNGREKNITITILKYLKENI